MPLLNFLFLVCVPAFWILFTVSNQKYDLIESKMRNKKKMVFGSSMRHFKRELFHLKKKF